MSRHHQRPKQPGVVHRALLDEAAKLAVEQGLQAVTVQAVASAAGVTKGGLLHHFEDKQTLLDALFHDLAETYEREIESRLADQPFERGRLTRAYIETAIADVTDETHHPRATLAILAVSDRRMRMYWSARVQHLLVRHDETDGDFELALVRFAADGFWLNSLLGSDPRDPSAVQEALIARTSASSESFEQSRCV